MLVTWNVRGLEKSMEMFGVRDFYLLNKFEIFYFQKSKLERVTEDILKSLGGNAFDWVCLPAIGFSGGMLIGWLFNKQKF